MDMIGIEIAHMHSIHVVHGDLTTSNMMLSTAPSAPTPTHEHAHAQEAEAEAARVTLIDFGLASVSTLAEDHAVDLYVLERAFASTHPHSEQLFARLLAAYFSERRKRAAVTSAITAAVEQAHAPKGGGGSGSGRGKARPKGDAAATAASADAHPAGGKLPHWQEVRLKLEEGD